MISQVVPVLPLASPRLTLLLPCLLLCKSFILFSVFEWADCTQILKSKQWIQSSFMTSQVSGS